MIVVRHQDVGLAADELEHHLLQLARRHLAVADDDPRLRDELAAPRRRRSGCRARGCGRSRPARRGSARGGSPAGSGFSSHGMTSSRRRAGPAAASSEAEMSRMPSSDMCSVRGIGVAVSVSTSTVCADCLQPLLVLDAEALLLVDDDQAEVLELHVLAEQPVRADDDVDLPLAQRRRATSFCSPSVLKRLSDSMRNGYSAMRSRKVR